MAAALAFAVLGCNSTESPNATEVPPGTYEFTPGNDGNYFVDSNFAGEAQELRIARQYYGRLVTVASCTPTGGIIDIVHTDFVIDPREANTWSAPFTLLTNPVDGAQTLCIAEDVTNTTVDPVAGTSPQERFLDALIEAAGGVRPVTDLGFVGAGNYTMVPRNAAFVIQFDDLVNPETINSDSIKIVQGDPAIIPFPARVFADTNFGGMADFDGLPGNEFYPTRIIIDPSISPGESLATGLSANLTGFPSSQAATVANIQLRLPSRKPGTQVNPILENPSEHTLVTVGNGTFDFGSSTLDIVRAFRSGGLEAVTGDPFSGFLPDREAPQIVGAQGAVIGGPIQPDGADPLQFTIPTLTFNSMLCGQRPIESDVIITSSGISVLVIRDDPNSFDLTSGTYNESTVTASNVRVRVLTPVPAQFAADPAAAFVGNGEGPAQYTARFDDRILADGGDRERPQCFVTATPNSANFPDGPNVNITPDTVFSVRFSEPMNPEVMEPYDTVRVTRNRAVPEEPADYVAGTFRGDLNLQVYEFSPIVSLEHQNGSSETFFLSFAGGDNLPQDLAGNDITAVLDPVEFSLLSTAGTIQSGSRVNLFNSFDEEAPFADLSSQILPERIPQIEWTVGQVNIDTNRGRMRPRPVVREQVFVSTAHPLPGAMIPGLGTNLPLNPRGARTQFVWRYSDFGLSLYDDGNYPNGLDVDRLNMDVEAAYLSPLASQPVFESYDDFTMNMAHTGFLPDEVIDPNTGALIDANSGIVGTYSENLLDQIETPLQEVHPRQLGYTINPGDLSLTPDGLTPLIPLPMNQGVAVAEKLFFTWRDTSVMSLGALETDIGAIPNRVFQIEQEYPRQAIVIMGIEDCSTAGVANPLYLQGYARTAALPLLLDFRCYTNGTAATGNTFDHATAHATMAPFFRAFSAGGTNQAGEITTIDPDAETVANGGFDPTSQPPGAETPGVDNVVYFGALDLVTRVSRTVSIYFPAVDPSTFAAGGGNTDYAGTYSNATFVEPVLFPDPLDQPQGTEIKLAYRGTSNDIIAGSDERSNGQKMDPYGDFFVGLPENYNGGQEEMGVEIRGNGSCFDASFQYLFDDGMGNSTINNALIFLGSNPIWRNSMAQIQGARFFQVRMTFISNVATGRTPTVGALGFGWTNN
ncbi:MAG: hypothetical protein ACJA2W_000656 [Planctomycetota bacterium]